MANIINGHSKRGWVIHQTQMVDKLIEVGKIAQAKKIVNDLMVDFPNDPFVLQRKGQLCLYYGEYEEALELYSQLDDNASVLKLAFLGLKLKDMDLLDRLYYEFYGNPYYHYDNEKLKGVYTTLKFYLDSVFGVEKDREEYSFYERR